MLVGRGVVMGLLLGPRESASEPFLDVSWMCSCCCFSTLFKFSYALLAGTLPLQYCSTGFACRVPTWRLPLPGHPADLVHADVGAEGDDGAEVGDEGVHWVSGSAPGRKRIRLNKKQNQHTQLDFLCNLGHVCGRGCIVLGFQMLQVLIVRGGEAISVMMSLVLYITGLG